MTEKPAKRFRVDPEFYATLVWGPKPPKQPISDTVDGLITLWPAFSGNKAAIKELWLEHVVDRGVDPRFVLKQAELQLLRWVVDDQLSLDKIKFHSLTRWLATHGWQRPLEPLEQVERGYAERQLEQLRTSLRNPYAPKR
jgi:hypothetical protein